MPYLHLDKSKFHLQVIVGVGENYKPLKKAEILYNKVEALKKDYEMYNERILKEMGEIEKEIHKINVKWNPELLSNKD